MSDTPLIANASTAVEDLRPGHLVIWDGELWRVERNAWNRGPAWHEVTLRNTDATNEHYWNADERRTTVYAVAPRFPGGLL